MKRAYVYIFLAAVLFSTMEVAGRSLAHGLNPIQINFWRFFLGSLVLMPATIAGLRRRRLRFRLDDLGLIAAAGLVGVVVSLTFYQVALIYAPASVVAVIVCVNPVFIIPFACLFLHETFRPRTILSLALCMAGILAILKPWQLDANALGIVLAIASSVTFSLYSVIGMSRAARYGSIAFTGLGFLAGTVMTLAIVLASRLAPAGWPAPGFARAFLDIPLFAGLNRGNVPALLYFGVVGTGISYMFYFKGMEESSASTGSYAFFIKPALAPILAWLLLGERIGVNVLIGIAFIVAGSYVVFARREQRPIRCAVSPAVAYVPPTVPPSIDEVA